jgi:hypothetical protein
MNPRYYYIILFRSDKFFAKKILKLELFLPAVGTTAGGLVMASKTEIFKMRCLLDEIRTFFEENPDAEF